MSDPNKKIIIIDSDDANFPVPADNYKDNKRQFNGLIGALVGGIVGFFGVKIPTTIALRPFDTEVARLTREDVMGRTAAGLSNLGAGVSAGGMGGHIIEDAHALNLINSGKQPLAKFMYNIGGRGVIAMTGAIVGATVGALAMYKRNDNDLKSNISPIESNHAELHNINPKHAEHKHHELHSENKNHATEHHKIGDNWQEKSKNSDAEAATRQLM